MFSQDQKSYHSLLISQHTNFFTPFHTQINLPFPLLYFLSSKTLNHNLLSPHLWSGICIIASFFVDLQFTVTWHILTELSLLFLSSFHALPAIWKILWSTIIPVMHKEKTCTVTFPFLSPTPTSMHFKLFCLTSQFLFFFFHFYPQLSHQHLLCCSCASASPLKVLKEIFGKSKTGKPTSCFLLEGTAVTKSI